MYKLSHAADQDIVRILEYSLTHFGVEVAQNYVNDLETCFAKLADYPQIGRAVDHLKPGYYRFPHQSHVIFFQIHTDHILIQRVVHKSRDLDAGTALLTEP